MSKLIGIAGGSGSGKTTLARMVHESAPPGEVSIVSIDAFYHSLRSDQSPHDINYDHPDSLDFGALQACLEALDQGKPARVPVYDFATHKRVGEQALPSSSLVIVEGILALAHQGVRTQLHLAVYVSAPEPIRFQRRLDRDMRERGRTASSIREQWARTVQPMHADFVAPTEALADHVVDGTQPFAEAVAAILASARSR